MTDQNVQPLWRNRLDQMDCPVHDIRFPQTESEKIAQDEEWCEVIAERKTHKIRCHDYHELFKIRGLYEQLFYQHLRCCSPSRVSQLFEDVLNDFNQDPQELKVLDFGAGNGMLGDELRARSVDTLVGIDIIPEAKEATQRDRPGVYDDYLVKDLTDLPEIDEERLRHKKLNCLVSVAALGFGDIPPAAFAKALDLIKTPGWIAFNIKEDFLCERDHSGFCDFIRQLVRDEIIQFQAYRRYRHRISITGKPLYYVAVVARKLKDVPNRFLLQGCCKRIAS